MRRNSEWHHLDPLGTAGVITNGSAQVISNNLYDLFGVLRYQQGSAQTSWRWRKAQTTDETMLLVTPTTVVIPNRAMHQKACADTIYAQMACFGLGTPIIGGGAFLAVPASVWRGFECRMVYYACLAVGLAAFAACIAVVTLLVTLCLGSCALVPPPYNLLCFSGCAALAAAGLAACTYLWAEWKGWCRQEFQMCLRTGRSP